MLGRILSVAFALASALLAGCVTNRCWHPCCDAADVVVSSADAPPSETASAAVESPEAAAARRAPAIRMMDEARARTAYLPMSSEDEARKSMASMEDFPIVPNLIRIAAAMPKTMEAEMEAWDALKKEGTINKRLLGEVFYVVSRSNECGHCMGHIVFGAEAAKAPIEKVLDIDFEGNLDPRRRATFAFARKVSRDPHSVSPADIESLRPFFKDTQIVELILVINRYRTMNALAEAFGSPLETVNVFDPKNGKPKPDAKKPDGRTPDGTPAAKSDAGPAPAPAKGAPDTPPKGP